MQLALTALLSASLLLGCHAPLVPLQPTATMSAQLAPAALPGPYRQLQPDSRSGRRVTLRIYQNGARVIEKVPFFRQGDDNTCGQAAIAMLANFWGVPADYQQIVERENPFNLATVAGAIVRSLRQKGLQAQQFREAGIENLHAGINQGCPSVVLLDYGSLPAAHYVVVVGYNQLRDTLLVHDSLEGPYSEIPRQRFLQMWQNDSLRGILPFEAVNYRRLMIQVSPAGSP